MITNGMHRSVAFVAMATSVLAACGGKSGDTAGIDRTGMPVIAAYGTVSAFGSVVVNGVRYDTSQTRFVIDGAGGGTQADIDVGDVVLVNGTLDAGGATGVATTVWFDHNVEGPITAIDAAADTFVALGQLVHVSGDTSFDENIQPAALSGLAVGDVVEVSGLVRGDDSIDATRIERRPNGGGDFEATGTVVGSQVGLHTFFLGAMLVNYSVAVVSGVAGGVVANGQHVRVIGTFGAHGVLVASRVDYLSNFLGGASGERREVEGLITRFTSAADFSIGPLSVTTNAQTSYEGGTAADLGLNDRVEVEGALEPSGHLLATRLEVRNSARARIVGSVDSVNVAGGSLVVLGVAVTVDSLTRFEDQSQQKVRPFSLANLVAGDQVEVRGTESPAGSGRLLATLVERKNPQQETELQGFVESVAPPLFVILGVSVSTGVGTEFEGVSGVAQLAIGDLVEVEGQKLGDRAISATEVEVQD